MVLLNKTYHGFEELTDFYDDISSLCDFPEDTRFKEVKGEFQGTLRVHIVFVPAKGDIEK